MPAASLTVPLALSVFFGGAFVLNEATHGVVGEVMGVGHHHLFDYGDYHCGPHDNSTMGERHAQHMHDANQTMPHDGCSGGPMRHGGGMDGGGMMR